jgi:hypothetical protein
VNLSGAEPEQCEPPTRRISKGKPRRRNSNCRVYGISARGCPNKRQDGATQSNCYASRSAGISVDDLEVAQVIYLLVNSRKVQRIIDTITSKATLILDRFTKERKRVLDALRYDVRNRGYVPILFDFDEPSGRDLTETITLLARMTRFIIADITDAKSISQELQAIVPHLPSVPIQPLLLDGTDEYGMFEHFRRYRWVLPTLSVCEYQRLDRCSCSEHHRPRRGEVS